MKTRTHRPKMRFWERVIRFMSGRNGSDSLGRALLVLYAILAIANLFLHSLILYVLECALIAYILFRMLSRNLYARQKENRVYVNFANRVKNIFRLQKNKWRDRKTHVYRKCPKCKNVLRLPKVKGAHTVNCPCCHERFDMKI